MLKSEVVEAAPVVEDPKNAKSAKVKAPAKGTAAAPTPAAAAPIETEEDEANVIKEDQVELMRDRKILELESSQRRKREKLADSVRER
jgi:hypothetical protein